MQIGETVYRFFSVPNPAANGSNIDADETPTSVLRKNGVTVGTASVIISKKSEGYYEAKVELAEDDGWANGNVWSLDASYLVNGDAFTICLGGGVVGERVSNFATEGQDIASDCPLPHDVDLPDEITSVGTNLSSSTNE